jgi:hypothetical protein
MAYNVLGIRRFASPNKQTEGLQGLQTVGGRRRGNGAERNDLADWNPGAAEWRRSVYRLLSAVRAYNIIFYNI